MMEREKYRRALDRIIDLEIQSGELLQEKKSLERRLESLESALQFYGGQSQKNPAELRRAWNVDGTPSVVLLQDRGELARRALKS